MVDTPDGSEPQHDREAEPRQQLDPGKYVAESRIAALFASR